MKYRFQLRTSNADRQGKCRLCIIDCNGQWITTGLKLLPDDWNQAKQFTTTKADALTSFAFTELLNRVSAYILSITANKRPYIKQEFEAAIKGADINSISNPTVIELIDRYKELKPLSDGRRQHYVQLRHDIELLFQNIRIKQFTYECGMKLFKHYSQTCGSNTVTGKMHRIKAIIHFAQDLELIEKDPLRNIKLKGMTNRKTVLTINELQNLQQLYNEKTLPNHHQNALHIFLIACYTGLRIGDITRLRPHMISNNCIRITQQKTKQTTIIPLTDFAAVLLSTPYYIRTGQDLNRVLAAVAATASITKHITMHVGRHTFATVGLRLGMELVSVSKILGHTTIRETQKYLHLLDDHLQEQMNVFNKLKVVHKQATA